MREYDNKNSVTGVNDNNGDDDSYSNDDKDNDDGDDDAVVSGGESKNNNNDFISPNKLPPSCTDFLIAYVLKLKFWLARFLYKTTYEMWHKVGMCNGGALAWTIVTLMEALPEEHYTFKEQTLYAERTNAMHSSTSVGILPTEMWI